MIVYIVLSTVPYEGENIEAVVSTEDLAFEEIRKLRANKGRDQSETYYFDEWEVDGDYIDSY